VEATIWGCRGSLAAPGAATVRYGGNTSCVEVRLADGTLLVLDAGTGIRALGRALGNHEGPIHLLLTHLHLDHLEGLGFFVPFWSPAAELHIWGPSSPLRTLEERVSRYLSPPLFPLKVADSPASLYFHNVPEEPWQLGSATITAHEVVHPGPTVGYRIEEGGVTLAYIPDHEPALGVDLEVVAPEWLSGHGIAAGATVLLHDAQLTADEYAARVGWGHSSIDAAVAFARSADVERLVLFHHDPMRGDDQVERLAAYAQELWPGRNGSSPRPAYEGMRIDLSPATSPG
jgi:phosphoribosyl 1,2-cyclic phosphodiesterase